MRGQHFKHQHIHSDMRKLLYILLPVFFLACEPEFLEAQTTWYVSTTGNDGTGTGTSDNPWRTLAKACSDPEVSDGDLIRMSAGTYNEPTQINLPDGVSIEGAGIDQTIIHSSYTSGPFLKLESYGYWGNVNYGNQSISYLTLDGDLTAQSAITVNFRSNVKIHHVKVIDFYREGVIFWGQPAHAWTGTNPYETWRRMPNAWCSGNEVTNCIFVNNAIYSDHGYGNLEYGQQNGFIARGNTITQTGRAAGYNGYGIKFYDEGWNRMTKISYNTITVAPREYGKFNFSIENWNDMGGCEYFNNTLQGQIDFSSTFDLIGAGYGSWFHDNIVGFSSTPTNTEVGVTPEAGWVDKCIISNNIFRNLTNAITLQHIYPIGTEHPNPGLINNVQIYNNLIYNMGEINNSRWTYGGIAAIAIEDYEYNSGNTTNSVFIQNNTIVSSGIVRSNTYMSVGIVIAGNQTFSNVRIRNNIIKGFAGATMLNAPILAYGTQTNTNFWIQNNDFYGNGNSNLPLWDDLHGGQFYTGSGYSYTGNITTDPLFVSSSDFRLTASSGAISTGMYVGIPTDILGNSYNNPPSMGAYEYTGGITIATVTTDEITDIGTTTAISGGNVTSTGGTTVTARGVCWSTSPNPTISNNRTINGTGSGVFTSYITGLTAATTYYVRSYATNSAGTAYGNERYFTTDPEGAEMVGGIVKYNGKLVKIGDKIIRVQ